MILKERRLLLSGSADQIMRFWDLDDMQASKPPLYKMHAGHDIGVKFHDPIIETEEDKEDNEAEEIFSQKSK